MIYTRTRRNLSEPAEQPVGVHRFHAHMDDPRTMSKRNGLWSSLFHAAQQRLARDAAGAAPNLWRF